MEYDNDGDRYTHGWDAGSIVDGDVCLDPDTGEYVVVNEDGKAFSSQAVLKQLEGKKIRITLVSFEIMDTIEKMMVKARTQQDGN